MNELPHVLIVDSSRVIRASLSRSLKDHFEVREETSGESAWQTLVLDSSIVAVISGLHLPRLDGFGLVEKLRTNKLRRLNTMPFFLIASDTMGEGERQQARIRGVTDFVPKGLGAAETERIVGLLLERRGGGQEDEGAGEEGSGQFRVAPKEVGETSFTGVQSDLGVSDILGQMGRLAGLSGAAVDEAEMARARESGSTVPDVPGREGIDAVLAEHLPESGQARAVGVLIFGLDSYQTVARTFGQELADKIETKFARLLGKKIRTEDSLGRFAPGRIAIVAPGTNLALCAAFAERVCKGLAAAQISIRGQRIDMTVSVGVASVPEDGVVLRGDDLLDLALGRLEAAMKAGGNRVVTRALGSEHPFDQEEFVQRLGELLGSVPPEALTRCLGNVGLKMMPLVKQIEQSFNFGLPIDDMERKLWARARSERQVL